MVLSAYFQNDFNCKLNFHYIDQFFMVICATLKWNDTRLSKESCSLSKIYLKLNLTQVRPLSLTPIGAVMEASFQVLDIFLILH